MIDRNAQCPGLKTALLIVPLLSWGCGLGDIFLSDPVQQNEPTSPHTVSAECVDDDHDGYGEHCLNGSDCDDHDPATNPGMAERCGDDLDNDCNGVADEGCECQTGEQRICSSVGNPLTLGPPMTCRPGMQYCLDGAWSDECTGEQGPTDEICNGLDDDCDGRIDEGMLNGVGSCSAILPPEYCGPTLEGNGLDDNGDGVVDNGCSCAVPDYDPDLSRKAQPCYSGSIHTLGVGICHGGARDCSAGGVWGDCVGEQLPQEEQCDGLDNDCDGWVDEGCFTCTQGEPEQCDGIDNDCDGVIDNGVINACGSCGAVLDAEICGDGLDNNCNGQIDETCGGCEIDQPCFPGPPEKAGVGACAWGTRSCDHEFWSTCSGFILPTLEQCGDTGTGNGIDEDCDGIVDNGCTCIEGTTRVCGKGSGQCQYGVQTCVNNQWGACNGEVAAAVETCDGIDNDCDGLTDEDLLNACGTCGETCYTLPLDPAEQGVMDNGIQVVEATDAENPSGRKGITLTKSSFIPPYLWAANHADHTVTKFNTETNTEEGIYWVGSNPSRTAVDLDGNMWVGGRNDGRLTKVLWDTTECDPMNNGVPGLQTSSGRDLLNSGSNPFADDCVVYSAVPNANMRSIRGVAAGPDGRIWIGYSRGGVQAIDPYTFALGNYFDDANIPRWDPDADGVLQPTAGSTLDAGGVYGLVIDAEGLLYTSSYSRNSLAVFDTRAGQEGWTAVYKGLCGSYGIAVDGQNRIWGGGYPSTGGITMFDPEQRRFFHFRVGGDSTLPTPGSIRPVVVSSAGECGGHSTFRTTGVAVEPDTGNVWTSFYPIGYTGRLVVDENDFADSYWVMIGTTRSDTNQFLAGVRNDLRGVGFDRNGFAWTLGLGSDRVWKIDPATNARAADLPLGKSVGVGSHYTYSDFTGSTALNFTAPRGFWRTVFSTQFAGAILDGVQLEAYVPAGTTVGIRVRALDESLLPTGDWQPPTNGGAPQFAEYPEGAASHRVDLKAAGQQVTGFAFEVDVRLTTTDRDIRPIVHDIDLLWQRP